MELNIITKQVGNFPIVEKMEYSLKNMQNKVGGHLEAVALPMNIDMWCNDEGLINDMPINLVVIKDGVEVAVIHGDVFFASYNDNGDTISLNNEQMAWLENRFQIIGESTLIKEGRKCYLFGLILD